VEDMDLKTTPSREPIGKRANLAGGEVDETSVSLCFFGDTLDPDEISNLLDCRPTNSYRKSDDLEIWRKLANQYHSDLFCGLFMDSWNREIDFSPELMAQISARGLTLSFDIYYVETRLIPVAPNFSKPSSNLDE
jgi:hypothetical protein